MLLKNIRYQSLRIDHWEIDPDDCVCMLGGNASGKGLLAAIVSREATPTSGQIVGQPDRVRWASFERQQALYDRELRNDDTDYMDRLDTGSTGLELLLQSGASEREANSIASKLKLEVLLDRGYRLFSSGEARKILLAREILQKPDLLILDEPFEGLDKDARKELNECFKEFAESGQSLLFLVNRAEDIPEYCNQLGLMQRGRIVQYGNRGSMFESPEVRQILRFESSQIPQLPPAPPLDFALTPPLVLLKRGRVAYGNQAQFENLDWELEPGNHTLITGPNGAGKSTLLQLLSGDHPQCYSNDLQIFGRQRGTGESIWDIKKNIGIVSASLHRDYRAPGNALTTVVSGFYDSIGLYEQATPAEKNLALEWLDVLGLLSDANTYFRQLSWGQQRLVLIARCLIKQPPLLILDEPTQGLDDLNRHLALAFIETLASLERTTILFVSHRDDEHLALFKRRIHFVPDTSGAALFEARVETSA